MDDPNDRNYDSTSIGTWSSLSDVDTFLTRFNHDTAYKDGDTKLRLGNYVTIQDGTYNTQWEIAGFDMEHNQTAADGTVYDNGYGICMIPKSTLFTANWHDSNTSMVSYIESTMHTSTLPTVVTNLRNVLGSHIVNRNVLLSSNVSTTNKSNDYTWTVSHATLMSYGQLCGTFATSSNKYDDGEANYKLPLFNNENYYIPLSYFWLRGISGSGDGAYGQANSAYYINSAGSRMSAIVANNNSHYGVRPLIYLR